jgi:hypothetical protein
MAVSTLQFCSKSSSTASLTQSRDSNMAVIQCYVDVLKKKSGKFWEDIVRSEKGPSSVNFILIIFKNPSQYSD